MGVGPLEVFIFWVCKKGLKQNLQVGIQVGGHERIPKSGYTLVADLYTIFSRILQSTKRWLNCILHSQLLVDCRLLLRIAEKHNFNLYLHMTSDRRPLSCSMATKETLMKLHKGADKAKCLNIKWVPNRRPNLIFLNILPK